MSNNTENTTTKDQINNLVNDLLKKVSPKEINADIDTIFSGYLASDYANDARERDYKNSTRSLLNQFFARLSIIRKQNA